MTEPVTLTLTITNDNGTPKRNHPDPNHPGKYLHPVLHRDDTLKLQTTPTAWPQGITEIKFYRNRADYQNDTTFATWVSGTREIKKDGTTVFTVTEDKSGSVVTDVKLKDAESLSEGEDAMFYKVFLGPTHPLDPEVVNKSGTGSGRNNDHWVSGG